MEKLKDIEKRIEPLRILFGNLEVAIERLNELARIEHWSEPKLTANVLTPMEDEEETIEFEVPGGVMDMLTADYSLRLDSTFAQLLRESHVSGIDITDELVAYLKTLNGFPHHYIATGRVGLDLYTLINKGAYPNE